MINQKIFTAFMLFLPVISAFSLTKDSTHYSVDSSFYEDTLISHYGLVNITQFDSTIKVLLKYASERNFMGMNAYGQLKNAFLQREAAEKLSAASAALKSAYPHYSLLVVDGFRPRQVQRKMYAFVKGTPMQKYIADPRFGSMHNYGCAVDITIIDTNGNRLDMGTPVDDFSPLSQPRLEQKYFEKGVLNQEQLQNRKILRDAMIAGGFHPLAIEWWHFEALPKAEIKKKYYIIE